MGVEMMKNLLQNIRRKIEDKFEQDMNSPWLHYKVAGIIVLFVIVDLLYVYPVLG
jgi:hypothetical protein